VGEVVNGIVQAVSGKHLTLGLDKKAEGIMPIKEQIRGERFRVHDRVRALLLEVKQTPRGPQIILSRSHKNFLRRLLEDEVPEIYHGLVEIRSISREPGQRSKVAVSALQPGIDPVGACVGVRGVRIQAIVRELNDEKIDVIEWNADPSEYIAKALSPARVVGVFLDKYAKGAKTATVVVPEDQLSLAIGRDGQNARLAAKLTGWRIDIKSLPEAASDSLYKLQVVEELKPLATKEADHFAQIETILAKKSEGRVVTPEEYQLLGRFVNRVENHVIQQRESEKQAELEQKREIRETIPDAAFETPVDELEVSPRFTMVLAGEGFATIGDLMFQVIQDPDVILGLNGIGPKAMEEIQAGLQTFLEKAQAMEAEAAAQAEAEAAAEAAAAEAEAQAEAEAAEVVEGEEEAPVEAVVAEAEEPAVAPEAELEAEPAVEEAAPEAEGEAKSADEAEGEEAEDLDEIFKLETIKFAVPEEETLDEDDDDRDKRSKKKRFVEMEYDPDRDEIIVKRKRKRQQKDDWMESWDDEWD
jgi:N utilization substance protein A